MGGRELSRSARTTRPSVSVRRSSSCHSRWLCSSRSLSPSRIRSASSRASASRAKSSAATRTERRSRRSSCSIWSIAASARSRHSADCSGPTRDSANEINPLAGTSGLPSEAAFRFCASISARTAASPPRATCSATTCCSAGREAISASRCLRRGRSLRAFGRGGRSGVSGFGAERSDLLDRSPDRPRDARLSPSRWRRCLPVPSRFAVPSRFGVVASPALSPSGRSPRGLRRERGPRSPSRRLVRSPSPLRPPRRALTPEVVTEPPPRCGGPSNSIRSDSGLPLRAFGGSTAVTKIPSISKSASTRTTSPAATPVGTRLPSRVPLGCLAPAARHVHEPSSRRLVSSTSMRRLIVAPHFGRRSLCAVGAPAVGVAQPTCRRHGVLWGQRILPQASPTRAGG